MSKVAPVPRTVGWTVAITAPLAAALALVVSKLLRRPPGASRTVRSVRVTIHDVPPRPALWDARPTAGAPRLASLRQVSPVPPENNHAPPTPPHGTPRQAS